jgi:Ran GTPase-activating protein (RanGAP) involved in mRNA processing and transport
METISSVNLLKNDIGVEQAGALVMILKEHPTLKSLCGNKGGETELDMSGKMKGAEDAIMLAAEIVDNRALSVLNLADNNLGHVVLPEGWTHDYKADYSAKEYNHTDGRKQDLHPGKPEGIIALAAVIPGMGALSLLNVASNGLLAEGTKLLADALKGNQIMTELNISSNSMTYGSAWGDISGVVALADVIPDMGAMTSLNLASNDLGAEGAKHIAALLPKCT